MPLSRRFPVPYIHIYGWAVCCSSVMMKDDICDKGTDHKLSNHSRNCLLAAPLVMLSTLPHVCVTPHPTTTTTGMPLQPSAALLSWTHLVSVYFDGNKSESHCGHRRYKPTLSAIKHLLASLPLKRCWMKNLLLRILTHVDGRMLKKKTFICIIKT